ncbi:hypothetical protein ACQ7AI_11925 [Lactococcus petauri]
MNNSAEHKIVSLGEQKVLKLLNVAERENQLLEFSSVGRAEDGKSS